MIRKLTAIVIGNNSYPGAVLKNPINDAKDYDALILSDKKVKEV